MHKYFIKTPWLIKKLFPEYIWSLPSAKKTVYLTFDDGPHPTITPFVLEELKKYNAAATFFCVGKNVVQYQDIYNCILESGHAVGNHTCHHLNGWKVPTGQYIQNIREAAAHISSNLFRPPYGRIRKTEAKQVAGAMQRKDSKIIMWDVLSADFDTSFSPRQCLQNVMTNVSSGSIIVFHDSEKAFPNLQYVLPAALEGLARENYQFEKIEL